MNHRKTKAVTAFFLVLSALSLISAYYSGSWGGYSGSGWGGNWLHWENIFPSTLLENEWVVFFGVFLVAFSLAYIALSRAFGLEQRDQSPQELIWGVEHKLPNRGPAIIVSLVVGFFIASAFTQRAFVYGLLGEEFGKWIMFIVLAFLFILAVSFLIGRRPLFTKILAGVFAALIWIYIRSQWDVIVPYSVIEPLSSFVYVFDMLLWIALAIVVIWRIIIPFISGYREAGENAGRGRRALQRWRAGGRQISFNN